LVSSFSFHFIIPSFLLIKTDFQEIISSLYSIPMLLKVTLKLISTTWDNGMYSILCIGKISYFINGEIR